MTHAGVTGEMNQPMTRTIHLRREKKFSLGTQPFNTFSEILSSVLIKSIIQLNFESAMLLLLSQ
jgi:hypothetical protein